jgi:hypothetical protein
MFKRTVTIGIVGVMLAATHGGDAQAHYYMAGGYPIYHTLASGILTLASVPNPTTHPAAAVRTALIEEYQFLCLNPAGNQASTTVMLRNVTFSVSQDVAEGNWNKKKGTVTLGAVDFDLGSLTLDSNDCVNPNWIPQPDTLLVTKLQLTIEALLCDDEGVNCSDLHSKTIYHCFLEGGYHADFPGGTGLPPSGTQYTCPADQTETFHFK